jgi:gentisate 1,2-dioxygenase
MPPHRHSPCAIRFGLTGKQNFTGIEGEDIVFGPGDLCLTPQYAWHNHGNVGDEPAVNLSVLDLPLVETLNAIHFDHDYKENGVIVNKQTARVPADYSQRIYGKGGMLPRFVSHHRAAGHASPMYCYRWEPMREMLEHHRDWDGDPYEALMIEYVDPTNGQPVYKTMTFFAQMLRPGERTRPLRQTASLLVTPFEGGGRGHSIVGGKRFDWQQFDTLAVPGGEWYEHVNESKDPVVFFVASDEPALRAFGLHKKWGRTASGDVEALL